jgi:hypothetical protein
VSRHAGNAAFAAAITAADSAADASGTVAVTSPVAGFVTSATRPDVPSTGAPAAQWCSGITVVSCSTLDAMCSVSASGVTEDGSSSYSIGPRPDVL